MKNLVEIIKENPGCVAIVDNDCWQLYKSHPEESRPEFDSYADEEAWLDSITLASDGEVEPLGDGGYGSGNCYGGDLLQALAAIVGIKVESV